LNAFKITKLVDRASPTLLLYAGNGSHIAQLDLYLRKSGGPSGKGLVFLQYSFKLVFVSDIEWNGDRGEDAVREDVTFTYGALLGRAAPSYAASDESTGAPQGTPVNETLPPRADKHLTLRTTLTPLKTHGVLWANYDWDLGAHFVDEHPPVVVATALDDYMA